MYSFHKNLKSQAQKSTIKSREVILPDLLKKKNLFLSGKGKKRPLVGIVRPGFIISQSGFCFSLATSFLALFVSLFRGEQTIPGPPLL